MGTSAGKGAVSSVSKSPEKLVRDPAKWASTDGANLTNIIFPYGSPVTAAVQGVNVASKSAEGSLTGRDAAGLIPGVSSTSQGVQYATRGAGGTDTPPEIPAAESPSLLPTKKRKSTQNRAGTMLTDGMGTDLSTNLGSMGGRSTMLGL